MKENIAYELHKPARKRFIRRAFKVIGINETVQIDLIDMQSYSKDNLGYNYILTLIDIFSKKAYAIPLKNKTGPVVTEAIQNILPKGVKNIQSDQGNEFFNKHFKALMQKLGINHYHTYSTTKAAIVERFQRTLKNWLFREISAQGSYRWLDLLPKLIKKYNNKIHRSIGMKPNQVNVKNSKTVYKNLLLSSKANKLKVKKPKFKVGDSVRISKHKHVFSKSYTPSWTTELFTIIKIKNTKPTTYILKDENGNIIKGGFYEQELLKTKYKDMYLIEKILSRKGDKLYVKWLGFPNSKNSYINVKDILN